MKSSSYANFTTGIAVLLLASLPAFATFPGKNGRIAFVLGPDIYTMKADGSDVRQLTNLGSTGVAFVPSWSTDGKLLVFNQTRLDSFRGQLWVMNADGTRHRLLLAEESFNDWTPSFSPDGRSVIFTRCKLDIEACAVYTVGMDGGHPQEVTAFELGIQDFFPEYSPDGLTITFNAFGREGIVEAIYRLGPDDKKPVRLTPPALDSGLPDWSPDGSRITFATNQNHFENSEIAVVGKDGDALRLLTNNGNDFFSGPHDYSPSWSPQGDAIAFERDAPDFSSGAIFVLRVESAIPLRIMELPAPRRLGAAADRAGNAFAKTEMKRRLRKLQEGFQPRWGVASDQ
jgi:Tol biopolymer transport system component